MNSTSRLLLCACAGAVTLSACDRSSTTPEASTCMLPVMIFGLQVTVVDFATGAAPSSATLIAQTTAAVDSVGPQSPEPTTGALAFYAAMERAGTYTLTVRSPGYRDWVRTGVQVTTTTDGCHVNQTRITARLQH